MTELTIERLGHLGDGIAPGPVFVPRTLPGEQVAGSILDGRMEDPRIAVPSPHRVRPPCRHFKACGACALQHASDDFVADWKVDQVRIALAAHGLDAPIRNLSTSAPGTRRRAVLAGRRTKKGATVGFHARASDTIVEVPDCRVLVPEIVALLPALSSLTRLGASRRGELTMIVTATRNGADIAASGGHALDGPLRAALAGWAGQADIARLTWNDEKIAEIRAPEQDFDTIACVPPPGAFLQATRQGEQALQRAVAEAVGKAARVVDLFAGCGTFALPLARGAEVHAVESSAAMLQALDAAWRHHHGLKRITTETRDLFRRPLLPQDLAGAEAVVIDPPRAGAEAQMARIAESEVPRIAAVSCNPVTFARDAALLAGSGFRLDWIDVVDQFRWSPHIELAARFSR